MRYGLISNLWRNWGRVPIPKQMEYEWGYLWAEIDVLAGEVNVWLLPEMNGATLSRIVAKMPEKWGNNVALVWDNAGAHKSAAKHLPDGVSVIPLPAYSPELTEKGFLRLLRYGDSISISSGAFLRGTGGCFSRGTTGVFRGYRESQAIVRISMDS
jgi:hypothetical protein